MPINPKILEKKFGMTLELIPEGQPVNETDFYVNSWAVGEIYSNLCNMSKDIDAASADRHRSAGATYWRMVKYRKQYLKSILKSELCS